MQRAVTVVEKERSQAEKGDQENKKMGRGLGDEQETKREERKIRRGGEGKWGHHGFSLCFPMP